MRQRQDLEAAYHQPRYYQENEPDCCEVLKSMAACFGVACLLLALPIGLLMHGVSAWQRHEDMMAIPHVAVDLTEQNFNETIQPGSGTQHAACIVEFYASWCPHCHHYMPIYEKGARYFKWLRDKGELDVFVGRIDCAANFRLCNQFKIPAFPHLLVGRCEDFMVRSANISGYMQQTPQELTRRITNLINRPLQYQDVSPPPEHVANTTHAPGKKVPDGLVWTLTDVESATRMLWHMVTTTRRLHTGPEKREALFMLLQWWAAAHASSTCQEGARKLVAGYNTTYWPEAAAAEGEPAPQALRDFLICGGGPWQEVHGQSWVACHSEKEDARGFTCALWLLFHTSAARLPPGTETSPAPASLMARGLRAFGNHFFQCQVCQKHFSQVVSRPEVDHLATQRDAVLWMWRIHNEVNARLARIEEQYGHSSTGDSDYPKIQWPAATQCPACRKATDSSSGSTTVNTAAVAVASAAILGAGTNGTDAGEDGAAGVVINEGWDEDAVYAYLERTFHAPPPKQATLIPTTTASTTTTAAPTTSDDGSSGSGLLGRKGSTGSSTTGTGIGGGHVVKLGDPVMHLVEPGSDDGERGEAVGLSQPFSISATLVLWPIAAVLAVAGVAIGWLVLSSTRKSKQSIAGSKGRGGHASPYSGSAYGNGSEQVAVAGDSSEGRVTLSPHAGQPLSGMSIRGQKRNSNSSLHSQPSKGSPRASRQTTHTWGPT